MKREHEKESAYEGRDRKRNKEGWKAQLKTARKAKAKRKAFETGTGTGKGWK